MGVIRQLPEEIITKIAAGEVVQNPASVVKELVENSIDAQATQITVTLEDAGKQLIQVQDNGIGMIPEDARLALQRHATSKIRSADDLFHITSLGFRGEALASIAAVSKLTLMTKSKDLAEGWKIYAEGGTILEEGPVAMNSGTLVGVRHLFYNTPARKKYLKSNATEMRAVMNIVQNYALFYWQKGFKLLHNKSVLLHAPPTTDMRNKIALLYSKDLAQELLEVNESDQATGLHVYGFISKPSVVRKDRQWQSLFLNKRYVKNALLLKAVEEAYHSLLFHGTHPFVALHIALMPENVDVNVHPAKITVKIADESKVYQFLYHAITSTLDQASLLPKASLKPSSSFSVASSSAEHARGSSLSVQKNPLPSQRKEEQQLLVSSEHTVRLPKASSENEQESSDQKFHDQGFKILGQLHATYILVEGPQGLVLIDQHAAHERILYEQFYEQYLTKAIQQQTLLQPLLVEMSVQEWLQFQENKSLFEQLGFAFESFGNQAVVIRKIPLLFERLKLEDFIALFGSSQAKQAVDDALRLMIATMACRAAVKAGDLLTVPQMKSLLQAMHEPKYPYSCPHGRPTTLLLTLHEIEKLFKRKA